MNKQVACLFFEDSYEYTRKVRFMGKQEFIDKLRISLNGQMTSAQVSEHLRYYEDYINTEIRKGRGEADVLGMLGDPRLIARSIMDAGGYADEAQANDYGSASYRETDYEQYSDGKSENWRARISRLRIPGWLWSILGVVLVFFIIRIFFSVLSFLLPLLFPMLMVVFIIKLFRDWLH